MFNDFILMSTFLNHGSLFYKVILKDKETIIYQQLFTVGTVCRILLI